MGDRLYFTGAAYSLFRCLLGSYLAIHFLHLLPWVVELFSDQGLLNQTSSSPLMNIVPNVLAYCDSPFMVVSLCTFGFIASICFALGQKDKIASVVIAVILSWFFQRNPLIANPSLPLVGWMLIFHVFTPAHPCWSLSSQKHGINFSWRLPNHLWMAAWIVLSFAYSYSGYTKLLSSSWLQGDAVQYVLNNPLARDHLLREWLLLLPSVFLKLLTWGILYVELLFAPLALFRKLRPIMWTMMLIVQIGFLIFLNFADLTFPMLLIHFLTFDPNWVKPKTRKKFIIYYDGHCGLCHNVVKFVLSEDQYGDFKFKPLQDSQKALNIATVGSDNTLTTFVLEDANKNFYTESDAVAKIMLELGGVWSVIGLVIDKFPNRMTNLIYRMIGRNRRLFFKKPEQFCPVVPSHLSKRFIT